MAIKINWVLFFTSLLISLFSLSILMDFYGNNSLFYKQLYILIIGVILYIIFSNLNINFFKKSYVNISFYLISLFLLILLLFFGTTSNNAKSWFTFFGISIQPVELAKLSLILLLSKYFEKRHVQIYQIPVILVSFIYMALMFFLVLKQPDLGSAIVILGIWFGTVFISGISKKHLLFFFFSFLVISLFSWFYLFKEYQKERILNFIYPNQDLLGSGYNVYQAQIAIGSGGLWGKGISLGSQSNLSFLPEYKTDFIFAAFAEEWGFVGVVFFIMLYSFLIFYLSKSALTVKDNFSRLIIVGILIYFIIHFTINVGMNLGIVPVTGIPLPFMSAGGTHLLLEWIMLGIVSYLIKNKNITLKNIIYS